MTDFFAKKVVAEAAHKNSSVIDVWKCPKYDII